MHGIERERGAGTPHSLDPLQAACIDALDMTACIEGFGDVLCHCRTFLDANIAFGRSLKIRDTSVLSRTG